MEQKGKCNECELCRKMLAAAIRQTISELERCLDSEDTEGSEVEDILLSLKSILSTYDTSPSNCLRKRTKSLLSEDKLDIGGLVYFTKGQRAAVSIFITELKAFVGKDESAVADESAE